MSALIEMLTDYTHGDVTVPKLTKASQIDAGTKLSIDFLDPQTYAAGVVPALIVQTQLFSDLIDAGGTFSLVAPNPGMAINSAGLKFTGVGGQYVDLGEKGKFAAGATKFGFGGWVKMRDNAADANAYSAIGGYLTSTAPANCQWTVQRARGATGLTGIVSGAAYGIQLAVDEVAHVFFVATVTAGSVVIQGYKNGILLGASGAYAMAGGVLPVPAVAARIGQSVGYSQSPNNELGSWDMEDFSVAGAASVADFLSKAYGDNVGRFA